ncbi:MAG: alpha/beta fold hydrolase, partial [Acetobacteraceae bacterium]
SASLGRITAPTLIVWGDQDGFASRQDQDRLAGAIAGARLRVHAGGGHAPHWEDPARTASDLLAFLSAAGLRAHAGQQRVTNSF